MQKKEHIHSGVCSLPYCQPIILLVSWQFFFHYHLAAYIFCSIQFVDCLLGFSSFNLYKCRLWDSAAVFSWADCRKSGVSAKSLSSKVAAGNQAACLIRLPTAVKAVLSHGATWGEQSAHPRARRDGPPSGACHYRASAYGRIRYG